MFNIPRRRQSGVLDIQEADKENVLAQIISNTIQTLVRTNKVPAKNARSKWSSESLEATMDAIERNITSL